MWKLTIGIDKCIILVSVHEKIILLFKTCNILSNKRNLRIFCTEFCTEFITSNFRIWRLWCFADIMAQIPAMIFSILWLPLSGLLIDCFKTIEYFRFRFWSQNHCLFFFDSFFQKNLKSIEFPIVCKKGVILRNRTA